MSEPRSTSTSTEEPGLLSRLRGRLTRARSLDDVRAVLAALLPRVYRAGSRFELFLARDGCLVPVLHAEEPDAGESRHLIASLRIRLMASRRSFSDPQALAADETPARRPVICAPVLGIDDDFLGLLVVEGAPHHPAFDRLEVVALEGISAMLSAALPSAMRLGAGQDRRALDREAASRLQRGFMSSRLPPGAGVVACAEYRPAFDVGGDFYAVSYLGEGVVSATIGDVSGNGVSAALLMSRVTAEVERAVAARVSPAEILGTVNGSLGSGPPEMFVTAACARIDARRRRLTLASAGHVPIVIRRACGEVFAVGGASGTPLGMLPSCTYAEDELLVDRGDIMLLFTDGLLEALDHPSGHRGMELLREEIHCADHDTVAINERLRATVDRARQQYALDDVTWLALQITA